MRTKIINNVEYEIKSHHYNRTLAEIKIPKGWRLLKPSEALMLLELEQFDDWFFVEQPIKESKYVARFGTVSDWAVLDCNWDPSGCYAGLGVRLAKDLKKDGK